MPETAAILDANVLIPAASRDTLLRAAESGLYVPHWSADILVEVERNLVEHSMAAPHQARRLIVMITSYFPRASVTGYADIVGELPINAKDRHVLAVAIVAGAQVIVTDNLRDFPASMLQPYGIAAQSCDAFLSSLYERDPDTMAGIIREQVHDLGNPPVSVDSVLNAIALKAPRFVELIRSQSRDTD